MLTTIAFAQSHEYQPERIALVALDKVTAPIAAAARAQARDAVDRAAIAPHGFRFANLLEYRDPSFLPGGAKYDDLAGMLSVAAPAELWLSVKDDSGLKRVRAVYDACQQPAALSIQRSGDQSVATDTVKWILGSSKSPFAPRL